MRLFLASAATCVVAGCGLTVAGTLGTTGDAASGDGALDGEAGPCTPSPSFATDPRNCGSCGHDCLGGACTAGACEPFALVTFAGGGSDGPYGLFVAGADIYVTLRDSGKLVTCKRTGATCGTPSTLRSSLNKPGGVVVVASGATPLLPRDRRS